VEFVPFPVKVNVKAIGQEYPIHTGDAVAGELPETAEERAGM